MSLKNPFYRKLPDLSFHLTDTPGGPVRCSEGKGADKANIFNREDPEAQITIHIRSNHSQVVRLFHFFGREAAVPYVVAETNRLVQEDRVRRPQRRPRKVVLVGNAAPRDEEGTNGVEFHAAQVGEHLQVVAPPSAFLLVKGQIRNGFYRLPNDNNVIFPEEDQFRSSYIEEVASNPEPLVPGDLSAIPDLPKHPTVGYVDFFGNQKLITPDDGDFEQELHRAAVDYGDGRRIVGLRVGESRLDFFLALSLAQARPGEYIVYRDRGRGGRWNLAWVWPKGASTVEKQASSAHAKLGEPPEGSLITIR